MTHTPGPWNCNVNDQGTDNHADHYVAVTAMGETVARIACHERGWRDLPYKDNARLIAAAPAMFEALQNAIFSLEADGEKSAAASLFTHGKAALALAQGKAK